MLTWEDLTETEQLACTYSDFYKDCHGFRPRGLTHWTAADYKAAIADLHASIDRKQATFEGREGLREEGWVADETDPVLQQRAIWLAQERDRARAESAGQYWNEAQDAEAPRLRLRWLKEAA
jgi:hypothetical protein